MAKPKTNEEKIVEVPVSALGNRKDQKRSRAQDFVTKYANNVSVSVSNWDMKVIFGRILEENEIEEEVEVFMSKEMAKALTLIMTVHLKAYEATFGEIKIPDMAKLTETAKALVKKSA